MTTAYAASNSLPMSALPTANGITQLFRADETNAADATYAPDGLAAAPIFGLGGRPLQGNEIVDGGNVTLVSYIGPLLNSGDLCWVLLECTGGAQQTAPAINGEQAAQLQQVVGLAGDARNLRAALAAPGKSVMFTFDEAFAKSALGGPGFVVAGGTGLTIDTGGTGAGGMDTGSPAVSGYVAIYLIVNPTTGAFALLGQNEPVGGATTIYGGSNLPSGYTYSGLISVLGTDADGNFQIFDQIDRDVAILQVVYSVSVQSSPTALSLTTAIPKSAKFVDGNLVIGSSVAGSNVGIILQPTSLGASPKSIAASSVLGAAGGGNSNFANLPVPTPQQIWYTSSNTDGTPTFKIAITSYRI